MATKSGYGMVYDRENDRLYVVHEYGLMDISRLCSFIDVLDNRDHGLENVVELNLRVTAMETPNPGDDI